MKHATTPLHGVWAAVTTPFDADERFDEPVLRENLRRLAAAGVHGVYTTDADGEFYAVELDEFERIVDVFADETARLGLPAQVGVSWSSTDGIVRRLRHCVARGIGGAHVGHPTYMPMTRDAWLGFWDDLAAAVPEEFQLVHYNTPKMPNLLRGPDPLHARLVRRRAAGPVGRDRPQAVADAGVHRGVGHARRGRPRARGDREGALRGVGLPRRAADAAPAVPADPAGARRCVEGGRRRSLRRPRLERLTAEMFHLTR